MRLSAQVARIALVLSLAFLPATGFAYHVDENDTIKDTVHTTAAHENAAPAHGGEHKEKAFNPGAMIIEHISDNHEWHIYGHTHLSLPVIVKTDKGFEMFSSGNFRDHETHEFVPYQGKNYMYALQKGKIVVGEMLAGQFTVNENATKTVLDLSITKNVVTLFLVVGLMLFFFIKVANTYKKRVGQTTKGMQSFFEPLIIFVRDDIAKASIGKKYERYMPYLLTVFFFVWISNMLGLIPFFPGGANFTGNITITLCLAVITFIITLISANKNYWRHIFAMPGVPVGVLVILTPIEIFGMFLKPMVLMIRLFANITAGHIIALSFYALIFIFAKGGDSMGAGLGVSVASVAFCVFMMFLELLVAFIQAYVFTLLSAIYFGSAVEEHHHDENFDGLPNEHAVAH
jgi:F-type H+-transporting ATPase subunit a